MWRRARVLYILFLMRSFFSELKNDSATALSWQWPRWLILGARLLARQNRCQSLPYWLPWSECTMTALSGLRRHTAIISTSSASSLERVGFTDQPSTLRAKRSITTARYNQPCQVRM